jgi:uncharacterized protein RhaS with RHS repeats
MATAVLHRVKKKRSDTCFGDPIYPATGALVQRVDTRISLGSTPIVLTYDTITALAMATGRSANASIPPAFGPLWTTPYHRQLQFDAAPLNVGSSYAYSAIRVPRRDGTLASFSYNSGSSRFVADIGLSDTLQQTTTQFIFVSNDKTVDTFDLSTGLLTTSTRLSGEKLMFSYSTSATPSNVAPAVGYLLQVTDLQGRSIRFTYALPSGAAAATGGLVATVTDQFGRTVVPSFDANGNLTQLLWQDNTKRQFVYENAQITWAMTGVIDERGTRTETFGYDPNGMAVSTQAVGGVGSVAVTYTNPPAYLTYEYVDSQNMLWIVFEESAPTGLSVTQPNGSVLNLNSASVNGFNEITSRSQPAGSGCSASQSNRTYDANGNVASIDDFNGARTCYVSDPTSNQRTLSVEGLPSSVSCSSVEAAAPTLPAGSRMTSTQWHPNWPLVTKQAMSGTIRSYVYNGQADPFNGGATASCASGATLAGANPLPVACRVAEQATLDANGSQAFAATLDASVPVRSTTFTYDASGRPLTAADPRGNTTTFTYYTTSSSSAAIGDLKQVSRRQQRHL